MSLNPNLDLKPRNKYTSQIMAPSLDDLTGGVLPKIGERFILNAEGARQMTFNGIVRRDAKEGRAAFETGDEVKVLGFREGRDTVVFETHFVSGSIEVGRKYHDYFESRASEKQNTPRRER